MTETSRPLIHFTPPRNWINDPNGLFHLAGRYHLFYQHNPHGLDWGHMSWGHASSTDLVSWEHHGDAIPEDEEFASFSGSAIVDYENVSGLGVGNSPPVIAFYTAARHRDISFQQQHMAYSTDGGVNWVKFPGNPIIPCTERDVRDPKVFWSEKAHAWIMLLVHASENRVLFYRSTNLIEWSPSGSFGPFGYFGDEWECPDLIELQEPTSGKKQWCLFVSVGENPPSLGNRVKYILGDFDGQSFIADDDGEGWADLGPDFYAAQSWSNLPTDGPSAIWTGWMSNRAYCGDVPAFDWRGCLAQARELSLHRVPNGPLRLSQRPVRMFASQTVPVHRRMNLALNAPYDLTARLQGGTYLDLSLHIDKATTYPLIFSVLQEGQALFELTIHPATDAIRLIRDAGRRVPNEAFRTPIEATTPVRGDLFCFRLFFDHSALEVFSESGCSVFSAIVAPSNAPMTAILTVDDGHTVLITDLLVWGFQAEIELKAVGANG